MNSVIYDYDDYVPYLKDMVEFKSSELKGVKLKLSKSVGCHPSYLSQVFSKKVNFNLEQGISVNQFFAHNKDESRYFLWMLEFARASTEDLKNFFREQMEELRQKRLDLKNRIKNIETIKPEHQYKYYSSWVYSAIYVALSTPTLKTPPRIAKAFNLPVDLVNDALDFLLEIGLVVENGGQLNVTQRNLHLIRDNEFIQRHHINWRSKALQSIEVNSKEDLHYSSVMAIHSRDFLRLKEFFVDSISKSKKIIRPSPEEKVYAFTLDLFSL